MIGKSIEGKGKVGFWGFVFPVLGLGLLVAGLVQWQYGLFVAAVVPFVLAITLWLTREKPLCFEFTSEGLEVSNPLGAIPFSDIQRLRVIGNFTSKQFLIEVTHSFGKLIIPSRTNANQRQLFQFLAQKAGLSLGLPLPQGLLDYQSAQAAKFGTEKVFCCQISKALIQQRRNRRALLFFLALALGGAILTFAGMQKEVDLGNAAYQLRLWGVIFVAVGGVVGAFLGIGLTLPTIKIPENSGLVISPLGFALIDGPLRGELKWGEIKGLALKGASGLARGPQRIDIVVAGAMISLKDVYHHSIQDIYHHMLQLWKPA